MEIIIGSLVLGIFLLSLLVIGMGIYEIYENHDPRFILAIVCGIMGAVATGGIMFS